MYPRHAWRLTQPIKITLLVGVENIERKVYHRKIFAMFHHTLLFTFLQEKEKKTSLEFVYNLWL